MVTLKDVQENEEIKELVVGSQKQLDVLGYTEHSIRHVNIVSKRAGQILKDLGYNERKVELAQIAGYMHDIGNCVNRVDHAHTGAILTYNILKELGMDIKERTEIMMAIGNHDEETGTAVNEISAALILADKSDVHRDRVVNKNLSNFDIHDRVNYAVTNATVKVSPQKHLITLNLQIDEEICTMYEYFEIFLGRMMMCRKAAELLGARFKLTANGSKVL